VSVSDECAPVCGCSICGWISRHACTRQRRRLPLPCGQPPMRLHPGPALPCGSSGQAPMSTSRRVACAWMQAASMHTRAVHHSMSWSRRGHGIARNGHGMVTAWSRHGHGMVTAWSRYGHGASNCHVQQRVTVCNGFNGCGLLQQPRGATRGATRGARCVGGSCG
jgi:hypothetical protein